MAQAEERLLSKHDVLSSNASTIKKRKQTNKQKPQIVFN
jgi:hypothetical protein